MNAIQYCSILKESFLGSLEDLGINKNDIIFQQDNDPKHTSRLATQWFKEYNIRVLPWPAQSPDMNLIEHVWAILDDAIRCRNALPRNLDELWTALQEEWEKLDMNKVRALYLSMPRRVEALHAAKGSYTN
jgi:DDE superfamily endonuclease